MPNPSGSSRRSFLKTAGAIAGGVAATSVACTPAEREAARVHGFDRAILDPLAEVVLPAELGESGRIAAVDAFISWIDGYDPVAEEMHGYGYSEIRFLPADPAPAWRAQLQGIDLLAMRMRRTPFAQLDATARSEVVTAALGNERGERLPAPLNARHVAVALLAHWASSPGAWNLALGAEVSPGTCRPLGTVTRKPPPVAAPGGGTRA